MIDAGIIRPSAASRFDVPILATPEDVSAFLWARGINKPETLVERERRAVDEDIAEKRKRKARAEQGIETLGRM